MGAGTHIFEEIKNGVEKRRLNVFDETRDNNALSHKHIHTHLEILSKRDVSMF